MSMLMQMVEVEEEIPTCNVCGDVLDEENDDREICPDCVRDLDRKERQCEQQADYAARRSQYSHLIHEAVMEANESIVIEPNGDWRLRGSK